MEFTIKDKRVTTRERLPAKQSWGLLKTFQGFSGGEMEYEQAVSIFTTFIESWEFDGDPHDPESYAELDMFSEFMPLMNRIAEQVQAVMGDGKN